MMKEKEKIKTAAMATGSALKAKFKTNVANHKTNTLAKKEVVDEIIEEWGSFPRKMARDTIKKYGPPQEAIPSQLIWYNNGPWKRTRVLRDEIPHNFPQPHTDVLENTINYKVPLSKIGKLNKFDGSIYIDRTRGEVASRCDMEAANFISLNLMHDLVQGKITVKQARKMHGEISLAYLMHQRAPYAEGLQFEEPEGKTRFTDKTKIGCALLHQGSEKMKDELWRGNRKLFYIPILGFFAVLAMLQNQE